MSFKGNKDKKKNSYASVPVQLCQRSGPKKAQSSLVKDQSDYESEKVTQSDRRWIILLYYLQVLQAPQPKFWARKGETVLQIEMTMKLVFDQQSMLFCVIVSTYHAIAIGEVYSSNQMPRQGKTKIAEGSHKQQLIVDYCKCSISLTKTRMLINYWYFRNGEEHVTQSASHNYEEKIVKQMSIIKKPPQGSVDTENTWEKCRL